ITLPTWATSASAEPRAQCHCKIVGAGYDLFVVPDWERDFCMSQQKDLGLLILRAAGFLLVLTFGIQKIGWYVTALRTGKHLWSIGLAPLIGQIGFPVSISVILAIWVTFNESIGAFLIGCGLFTAHPGGERSVRNGWRTLHERATWRRLAQG